MKKKRGYNPMTLHQYAEGLRRSYGRANGISQREMKEAQPDSWYKAEHQPYVLSMASYGPWPWGSRFLRGYWKVYGSTALDHLLKHYPHVAPENYVRPDAVKVD